MWKHRSSIPLGPLPCSPLNFNHNLLKQGTGTADHLTLLRLFQLKKVWHWMHVRHFHLDWPWLCQMHFSLHSPFEFRVFYSNFLHEVMENKERSQEWLSPLRYFPKKSVNLFFVLLFLFGSHLFTSAANTWSVLFILYTDFLSSFESVKWVSFFAFLSTSFFRFCVDLFSPAFQPALSVRPSVRQTFLFFYHF